MNATDVAGLVARINALDPRIANTAHVVDAWDDLLRASAPDMPLAWAIGQVHDHAARTPDRPIRPGDLVLAWRAARRSTDINPGQVNLDAHCGRPGCPCAHRPPCYRGFNDDNPGAFCRSCNPARQDAIDDMPPPGQRSQFDFAAFIAKARGQVVERDRATRTTVVIGSTIDDMRVAPSAPRQRSQLELEGR